MKKYRGLSSILLIDDDEATNFLTEFTIRRAGLDVQIEKVYNAQDGLDFLCCEGKFVHHLNKCDPQLIFLDLNMPGIDGWDFLNDYQQLKVKHHLNPVIIILTTSLNPDDMLKSKQFKDVKGFLNKPLSKEIILSIVGQYFNGEKA